MPTELEKLAQQARDFYEPREGTGPRAVWLSWVETIEREAPKFGRANINLHKRAASSLRTVLNMAKGLDDESIGSSITMLVNSRNSVNRDVAEKRKR